MAPDCSRTPPDTSEPTYQSKQEASDSEPENCVAPGGGAVRGRHRPGHDPARHSGGIQVKANKAVKADFDIVNAKISTQGNVATFHMAVSGKAGKTHPAPSGKLAGSSVFSYVWPTSIDPYEVGLEKGSGVLAMALTAHPDFDDTPLYDENGDGKLDNDGAGGAEAQRGLLQGCAVALVHRRQPRVARVQQHELATPQRVPDLSRLPPALVVLAEEDLLCDEGLAYARRMQEAGVEVQVQSCAGQKHGFVGLEPTAAHEQVLADIRDCMMRL